MKVFVYGKTSDDKGHQLEALVAAILKNLGYSKITLNERGAGGHEVDVTATKKEPIGEDTTLICECKAHKSLVEMTDWLKFVGKIYLAHRKDSRAQGLMVALSGVNGSVMGNYKEIKEDKFITLITNEDIHEYITQLHPLLPEKEVVRYISQYTRKDVVGANIIYYDSLFYWQICFPNGEYTILKDDLSSIEDAKLAPFCEMIESQTDSRLFVNIKEEQEAIQRCSFIRSLILSYTLDQERTLKEITDWINSVRVGFNVSRTEVEDGIAAIPFLCKTDDDKVSVICESGINVIDFYRFILKDTVTTKVMATAFYKEHINRSLLDEVRKLQNNIRIPEENVEECLFLLKHSPSALRYSIYEDQALTRYRNPDKAIFPNLEKAHTEWFLDNIMSGFITDYSNSSLSEYYLDTEKIASIELHTDLKIFKDGEKPREIHHYKAQCIGHLSEEYGGQAVLMVKIPE